MSRIAKICLTACLTLACCSVVTLACADWSLEWTQNFAPEHYGSFTKVEFFITPVIPNAPTLVAFDDPTSILPDPGSSSGWTSTIPNSDYSLLTGPLAKTATLTTYFSGPLTSSFDLDIVVWNGSTVIESQDFEWVGGTWGNPKGTLLLDSPGNYNRAETGVPIASTMLLFAPAGFGVLLLRKRISAVPCCFSVFVSGAVSVILL